MPEWTLQDDDEAGDPDLTHAMLERVDELAVRYGEVLNIQDDAKRLEAAKLLVEEMNG